MGHAKFSPSSLKRVMACPASYAHAEALADLELEPPKSGTAAREGTIAHALAEFSLEKAVCPKTLIGKHLNVELDGTAESVEIDKDVADKVAVYVEHCNTLAMLAERRYVEREVHVTTKVQGHETRDLLWGTADFIALTPNDRIDVVDLKFGGMAVEPENNPQLVCYMLGALELLDEDKRPTRGALHIVQPKISHEPKIWEIDDLAALKAEWLPKLETAMERAINAAMLTVPVDGHYEAGAHCHFCPVLVTCEHFAKHMIDLTTAELEEITAGTALSPDRHAALVERFRAKSLVTRYYQQLEERLAAELRKGVEIPGIKIVQSLGHRKWALDDKGMAARFRNQGLKKKDFIVQSLISPAAAEKIIANKNFFEVYTTRPSTEKLVLDTDKRQSVNTAVEVAQSLEALPTVEREAPKMSATMALIDLGESDERDELETLDDLDIGESDELDLGDDDESDELDLGDDDESDELDLGDDTEEIEEIEL